MHAQQHTPKWRAPTLFYFPEDHPSKPSWFKGMKIIIRECGLWPEGDLLTQCPGFQCPPDSTDCCCRRILFSQPDFRSQKSQLEELVESHGHLCDFYLKYHCEVNFIEQYWGAVKLCFWMAGHAATIDEMERKVIQCLDDVPLLHIWWWVIWSWFLYSIPHHDVFLVMPTGLHASYQHIMLVYLDHKPYGRTKNITAIELCLWRSLQRSNVV